MFANRARIFAVAMSMTVGAIVVELPGRADDSPKPPRSRILSDPGHYPVQHSTERMLSQLGRAMEIRLFRGADSTNLFEKPETQHPVLTEFDKRPDLRGLPVIRGEACQLSLNQAQHLGRTSQSLRGLFFKLSSEFERRSVDWKQVQSALNANTVEFDAALLLQMLQCENSQFRSLLNQRLALSASPEATKALAHRCVFELDSSRRDEAIRLLKPQVSPVARQFLLDALRHPYAPFADHAAAALIAFQDHDSVPALVSLLESPDPNSPKSDDDAVPTISEVIKINHLRNCQLCHAPSWDAKDPARVAVPSVTEPLPTPFSVASYASTGSGQFVRADVTYLRQDFSLALAVSDPGPWPKVQRFDFFIRNRPALPYELQKKWSQVDYAQRYAVLRALRQITKRDFGVDADAWRDGLRKDGRFKL